MLEEEGRIEDLEKLMAKMLGIGTNKLTVDQKDLIRHMVGSTRGGSC